MGENTERCYCIKFLRHFFCKNTRQGIATVVAVVCIIGLAVTTIVSSTFYPWIPAAFMSALFASCMGLFCCNKTSIKLPREDSEYGYEREHVVNAVITLQQDNLRVQNIASQTPPSIRTISSSQNMVYQQQQPPPRTPPVHHEPPIVYQLASVECEPPTYPLIIPPPSYQQATCHMHEISPVQGHEITPLQGHELSNLRECETSHLLGSETSSLQEHKISHLQGHETSYFQDHEISHLQEYELSYIQDEYDEDYGMV